MLHLEITTCLDDGSNCSTNDGTPVPGLYTVALDGIETRVVEERESEGGELVEISHNFFARCLENGSVFYLGEKVEDIEDGEVVGGGGAWEAGSAMPCRASSCRASSCSARATSRRWRPVSPSIVARTPG